MESFPTTQHARQRLLVFARYPEPGRVKSRLARDLGEQAALHLYSAMLRDLLDGIGRSDEATEVEVMWTADGDVDGTALVSTFGSGVHLAMQAGADLGERLAMAFSERVLFQSVEKIIAIGTDDPGLDRTFVERAFLLLDSCDWVIGPARDGGYYLIGARAEAYKNRVFAGVEWGSGSVLETTLATIRRMKATVAVLPLRSDIDTAADLRTFVEQPSVTPNVLRAARALEVVK